MLTTNEAAALLPRYDGSKGVSPQRIRKMIASGRLPATKHGRDWLIDESDLAAYEPQPAGNPDWRRLRIKSYRNLDPRCSYPFEVHPLGYCWSYANHVDGSGPKFADILAICRDCDMWHEEKVRP